jgi:hypothetical protein
MRRLVSPALLLLTGCLAQPDETPRDVGLMVFRKMDFAQERDGVSPGFDLDGVVSTYDDARGCRQSDFMSPDGAPGIDNQLGGLIPLLDLVGEGALQAFIQNAIDEGRLLVMPHLVRRAGRLDLSVLRGADQPLVGTDGHLLGEQTLALSPDKTVLGEFEGATLEDGVLTAGPFDLNLPVVVFDILYDVHLADARLELRFGPDGVGHGVLAGSSTIEELTQLAKTAGERADVDLVALIGGVLEDVADLDRDPQGRCHALSAVATFETVPAYAYDEELQAVMSEDAP